MSRYACSLAIGALLGMAAFITPASAESSSATRLDLAYAVTSAGRDLGSIEVQIDRSTSPNRIEAVTQPQGIARLFADVVTEKFTFVPIDGGWHARDYSESGDDAIRMTFDYDDSLHARGAGEATRHPVDSLVEPQGFPLSAMMLSAAELPGREILTPSSRGLRSYRYVKQGEERVEVGGSAFDTVKWLKQRPDRRDRGYYIWTDKSTGVPVRIEKFKEGDVMVMELKPGALPIGS